MTYNQIKYGSQGSDVKELQKLLNQNGYSLDEDGIFGSKTQSAVRDYQTKNNLTVDGIVGDNTWGALTSGTSSNNAKNNTQNNTKNSSSGFSYDNFSYDDYAESDTVQQAHAALQSQIAAKPGEYQSTWQGQINDIIDRILNREEFSYDVNSDALYQQYKEQYSQLGKLAMQDTMGQAAAMTGGYGNSYASSAGNQAYQGYLSQLNEVVPELYAMARDQYNQEGDELYNNYSLLADQENQDYSRYQDEYNKWLTERDYLANRYDSERSYDYSKYSDERNFAYGTYSDDKSYAYNEYRNAIADEQWQKEYEEKIRQYNEQMALDKEQWQWQKDQYAKESEGSTYSYSGKTSSGKSYNNGSLSNAQVKELQAALGVEADGYYGPATKEAAGGVSAAEAYAQFVGGTEQSDTNKKPSKITSAIENKAASFENNDDLADWAYALADAGTITEDDADMLISTYMDSNEKYVDNDDGTKSLSFSDMIQSSSEWTMVDNGGWHIGKIDDNAIAKAPNGKQYTMKELYSILQTEGMDKDTAKSWINKLQKSLGIS